MTGASRGVGRHIAFALAAEGAHVALAARDADRLREVQDEIESRGGAASTHVFDAADAVATKRLPDAVEPRCGPVDILINNAGVNGDGTPFATRNIDRWWEVFEVNVRAPAILCRAILPGMLARGHGRIVNVSSGLGNIAWPNTSDYAASKAALTRLTEVLAAELKGSGVHVFAISPGTVQTDMTRAIPLFRDWTDWDSPEACGALCVAIATGALDALSGRFLGVREGIEAFIASADDIVEREMHVLRMSRLPTRKR